MAEGVRLVLEDISFQEQPMPKLLRCGLRHTLPMCFRSGEGEQEGKVFCSTCVYT